MNHRFMGPLLTRQLAGVGLHLHLFLLGRLFDCRESEDFDEMKKKTKRPESLHRSEITVACSRRKVAVSAMTVEGEV